MNKWQTQVKEFHDKFRIESAYRPSIMWATLRKKLILEEAKETCDAIDADNLAEAVDGICDLIYVALGAAITFGIEDLDPFFDEVHRSNMAKVGGVKDGDGKVLKPEGWEPPKIKELLVAVK